MLEYCYKLNHIIRIQLSLCDLVQALRIAGEGPESVIVIELNQVLGPNQLSISCSNNGGFQTSGDIEPQNWSELSLHALVLSDAFKVQHWSWSSPWVGVDAKPNVL